jgi:hypothetical protein
MAKTNQELLSERKERLRKAVALEKPDKTPFILMADAFCARHMGVKMSDFCSSLMFANQIMVNSCKALGDLEGITHAFPAAPLFPMAIMTQVELPGKELPDDSLWQLNEKEVMTIEDYDTILKKGWMSFMTDYLVNRLHFPLEKTMAELADTPKMVQNFEDAGYVVYAPTATGTVTELIGGGRSMPKFIHDLYKIPDKVEAVLDAIQQETMPVLRQQIRDTKASIVFLSPARGASEFYSPKLWERFVWKYIWETAEVIVEEGACCNIHIDSNWERDLHFFRSLPKAKCVFESDGVTNIYKIKEILGDHMCIKGDVASTMSTLGTPDDVYNYCTKIIRDMGPGFILSTGCSAPPDAKIENIKAMVAAAGGH